MVQSPRAQAGGRDNLGVPHSFAYVANEWALDLGKTLDGTTLDFQRLLWDSTRTGPTHEGGSSNLFLDPYGGVAASGGSDSNRYKFNGKERDAESGLDNFGARYDASNMGRFMTPDWAAKPVTVPYANFGNPQSLNLYAYVENNPTTLGDPDGHAWVSMGDVASWSVRSSCGKKKPCSTKSPGEQQADEENRAQKKESKPMVSATVEGGSARKARSMLGQSR